MDTIFEFGDRNRQIAFVLATELLSVKCRPELAQLLVALAVYGGVNKKDDQVLLKAHEMATRSGNELDE